jgi:VWFA-related protein
VIAAVLAGVVVALDAGQSSGVQLPPRLKSGVQLVEVDVRVFDRSERFVSDLTQEDFAVFEDDTQRPVEVLSLIDARPTAVVSSDPLRTNVAASIASQTWIFVFDHRHLEPNGFDRAKKGLRAFLTNRFRSGDLVGIVTEDRMVNNRISSIRSEILAALDKVKLTDDARSRQRDQDDADRAGGDREAGATIRELLSRRTAEERSRAARSAVETLDELANGLIRVLGLKAIVFFSDGFGLAQLEGSLRTAVDRLNRAGARVYVVDTRGLAGAPADALNSLAVDTGGLVIFNENNIGRALETIADDSGRYYLIGFQPANPKYDSKYRRIEVRVKRRDVRVRARRGYLAIDPARLQVPR